MRPIGNYHKHIDNGSLSIIISARVPETEEDFDQLQISMSTAYFGYPYAASTIEGCGQINEEDLREIGEAFIQAADFYKKLKTDYRRKFEETSR